MSEPITEQQIKDFVAAWYQALDFHVPIEQAYALLADQGFEYAVPRWGYPGLCFFQEVVRPRDEPVLRREPLCPDG